MSRSTGIQRQIAMVSRKRTVGCGGRPEVQHNQTRDPGAAPGGAGSCAVIEMLPLTGDSDSMVRLATLSVQHRPQSENADLTPASRLMPALRRARMRVVGRYAPGLSQVRMGGARYVLCTPGEACIASFCGPSRKSVPLGLSACRGVVGRTRDSARRRSRVCRAPRASSARSPGSARPAAAGGRRAEPRPLSAHS